MNKNVVILLVVLSLIASVLGWNYWAKPFRDGLPFSLSFSWFDLVQPTASAPTIAPAPEPATDGQERLAYVLAAPVVVQQSAESGVASQAAMVAWIKKHQPAVVTLFGEKITADQLARQVAAWQELPTQPLLAVDHEGGTVQRLSGDGFTPLPSWQSWCRATAAVEASNSAAVRSSARELQQAGIAIVLAPMLDLATNNPVLRTRVCSDKAEQVASAAAVVAEAYQNAGITPVFKHFPGIGETKRDLHQQFDRVTADIRDAVLYRALLSQFPRAGVMIAHVGVVNQYPDIPCSLSPTCVGQVVGGFPEVLVMTDAIEMTAAGYQPGASGSAVLAPLTLSERVYKAVLAGNQVIIFGPGVTAEQLDQVLADLSIRYTKEPLFAAAVNTAYQKVVTWRQVSHPR